MRFESLTGKPYQLFLLHDPALSMTGNDDTGRTGADGSLLSSDGTDASAVVTSPALGKTSSGYLGTSDGWTDLATDHAMDWSYDATAPGNVVQTGGSRSTGSGTTTNFTVAIGFGATEGAALSTAQASLGARLRRCQDGVRRRAGHRYLGSLQAGARLERRGWSTEWNVSAMVLAASEDKTVRGGFVAAPGRPWAWANSLQDLAVYHAVWSRDLYQIATGLLADRRRRGREPRAGLPVDRAAARRRLVPAELAARRHAGLRRPADGRGGVPDRAGPPARAHRSRGLGAREEVGRLRRRARPADAAGAVGERDRLLTGDHRRRDRRAGVRGGHRDARTATARRRRRTWPTADAWQQKVESLTATTTGPYSSTPYYLRITANGDPDSGDQMQVSDGGPLIDERQVVDPSFLDLVRLGVKRADDPVIRNSLTVVDDQLAT